MDLQEFPLVLRKNNGAFTLAGGLRYFSFTLASKSSIPAITASVLVPLMASAQNWIFSSSGSLTLRLSFSSRLFSPFVGLPSGLIYSPPLKSIIIIHFVRPKVKWLNDIFLQFRKIFFCKRFVADLSPAFKSELLREEGLFWRVTRLCSSHLTNSTKKCNIYPTGRNCCAVPGQVAFAV